MSDPVAPAGRLAAALDEVVERYGGGAYVDQIGVARAEYDERRGRVFEDEPLWESWTQAFLEWYTLERVLDGDGDVPAACALASETDPDRRAVLRALLSSHRSLFDVVATGAPRVELRDLWGGTVFAVDEQRALHGVARGDVVEARLVGYGAKVRFGRTFLYHPSGTRESITRYLAHLRGERGLSRRDAIDAVAALRVRCERYGHMSPERVYATAATERA